MYYFFFAILVFPVSPCAYLLSFNLEAAHNYNAQRCSCSKCQYISHLCHLAFLQFCFHFFSPSYRYIVNVNRPIFDFHYAESYHYTSPPTNPAKSRIAPSWATCCALIPSTSFSSSVFSRIPKVAITFFLLCNPQF